MFEAIDEGTKPAEFRLTTRGPDGSDGVLSFLKGEGAGKMNKRAVARVMIVDDDLDEAELISLAFKISGYPVEVVSASTAKEAISALIAPDRLPYDLVLLNFDSESPNGPEVLRHLADQSCGCWAPRVVLTSIVDPDLLEAWYQQGATSVLRKPQDFDGFAAMVSDLCAYWFRMNLLPKPA